MFLPSAVIQIMSLLLENFCSSHPSLLVPQLVHPMDWMGQDLMHVHVQGRYLLKSLLTLFWQIVMAYEDLLERLIMICWHCYAGEAIIKSCWRKVQSSLPLSFTYIHTPSVDLPQRGFSNTIPTKFWYLQLTISYISFNYTEQKLQ